MKEGAKMSKNKEKPLLIPYKYYWNGRNRTKYVAYCGICGNPIARATSKIFCCHCGNLVDWSDAPPIQKYILTERAIELTSKLI